MRFVGGTCGGQPSRRSFSLGHVRAGLRGPIMDEHRPFWEISDEPEQSQHYEEEDEQQQAVPRSGMGLRAIDPVKLHRRVPPPFQPLHEGTHDWERPRC
jgi:hypothetical protein